MTLVLGNWKLAKKKLDSYNINATSFHMSSLGGTHTHIHACMHACMHAHTHTHTHTHNNSNQENWPHR